MPCFQCCRKRDSIMATSHLELTCMTCGAAVVAGESICPQCGAPYAGNTRKGEFHKASGGCGATPEADAGEPGGSA